MSSFWERHEYRTDPSGLAKRGYMYQGRVSRSLSGNGTASCAFTTGDTSTIVYLREITSSATSVTFRLYEVDSIGGKSGSVQGQNLNRTITGSASASQAVLSASATSASVSTDLAGDVVGGSGGKAICHKIRTLQPETDYLLEWENNANATTIVSATILWSENEPDPYGPIQ